MGIGAHDHIHFASLALLNQALLRIGIRHLSQTAITLATLLTTQVVVQRRNISHEIGSSGDQAFPNPRNRSAGGGRSRLLSPNCDHNIICFPLAPSRLHHNASLGNSSSAGLILGVEMYGLKTLAAAGLVALASAQDALQVPAELTSFEPGTGTRSLWVCRARTSDGKLHED